MLQKTQFLSEEMMKLNSLLGNRILGRIYNVIARFAQRNLVDFSKRRRE